MSARRDFKSLPTNRKLLDLFFSAFSSIKKKDHSVAVMTIVLELLVLMEKKKLFIV